MRLTTNHKVSLALLSDTGISFSLGPQPNKEYLSTPESSRRYMHLLYLDSTVAMSQAGNAPYLYSRKPPKPHSTLEDFTE